MGLSADPSCNFLTLLNAHPVPSSIQFRPMKIMNLQLLSHFTRVSALCALASALSANAAIISIADFTATPDGSTTIFNQGHDVATPNGGNILTNSIAGQQFVYVLATLNFAAGTSVNMGFGFHSASTIAANAAPNRAGVSLSSAGVADITGGFASSPGTVSLGSVVGQSVTVLLQLDYDKDRNTSNNDDNIASFWINPTNADTTSSFDMTSNPYNSYNFAGFAPYIRNNGTLGTIGESSITDIKILTGSDATFANALALATVPEPDAAMLIGLVGFSLILRRRRC
jgi:hypothetical protein